jgi:aspartate aminotransferase
MLPHDDHPHGPAISRRSAVMPRSAIRRIFNAAIALQDAGRDVVRLDIGDPDFDLPARISEAVAGAFASHRTHYSAMVGMPEARNAIADHMERRFNMPGPDEDRYGRIVVNQGATQALNSAMQLCCDAGESILLPEVYWPNYIQQVTLAGIRPRFYRVDDNFQPHLPDLAALTDGTTRAVLMNSPSNPTGALFPEETVRAIYDFCRERGLWLISDEAYCDFVYEGEHVSPLALDWEHPVEERRVIGVFSFSKSYAATGLRLGWTVTPRDDVTLTLATMNEPLTGSLTTPLQLGLAAGVGVEDAAERRDALRGRWQLCGEILTESGLSFDPPAGGIFYFVDISPTGMSADEFADTLLEQEGVAVVPGSGFGLQPTFHEDGRVTFAPGERSARCVRLCFAVAEERLREGVKRMARFIASHTAVANGAG